MTWQPWLETWRTPVTWIAAVGVGYLAARLQWWWVERRSGHRQQIRWQSILRSASAWQTGASPSAAQPTARLAATCHDLADFESALLDQIDRLVSHERRLQTDLKSARTLLQHRSAELKLSHAEARRDPLSALYNRRGFDEMLESFLESRRYGRQFALIMVDVDHFKRINDMHGHMVGDRVLSWVGTRLMEVLRPTDCVARFGGDEFSILLREVTVEQARAIANRLLQVFRLQPFVAVDGPPTRSAPVAASPANAASIPVTLSLGVAVAEPHETAEGLIHRADGALYQAKKDGRNRMFLDDSSIKDQRESARHLAVACPASLATH